MLASIHDLVTLALVYLAIGSMILMFVGLGLVDDARMMFPYNRPVRIVAVSFAMLAIVFAWPGFVRAMIVDGMRARSLRR